MRKHSGELFVGQELTGKEPSSVTDARAEINRRECGGPLWFHCNSLGGRKATSLWIIILNLMITECRRFKEWSPLTPPHTPNLL